MREAAPASYPEQLHALTSFRALLALGVALFHYHLLWAWTDAGVTGVFERARLGLDAFFILSGFILTHVHAREVEAGRYRHGAFLVARLARIYPMHLAALGLFVTIVGAALWLGRGPDPSVLPWGDLLRALTLTQSWGVDPRPNQWNGPSWSLSAEWFAYLAFPAFAWISLRLKDRPWLLMALALLAFAALDALYQAAYGRILTRAEEGLGILRIAPEFLLGVALYRLGESFSPSREAAPLAALACGGALLVLMQLSADDRLIVLAFAPLILSLALMSKATADGPLARPWMLQAGEASYAFYLLHMPVLIGWRGAAQALGRTEAYRMPAWEVAAALTLTAVAALVAHRLWERPARRLIRRWAAPHPRAGPVAAA